METFYLFLRTLLKTLMKKCRYMLKTVHKQLEQEDFPKSTGLYRLKNSKTVSE